MKRTVLSFLSMVALALVLSGCSGMRLVDSDVTAYSTWPSAPPSPGTPYRFERLPSQQAIGNPQDSIELLARSALAKVGLELNPQAARYSVQVVLNTQVIDRLDGGLGGFGGFGGFGGYGGYGYGSGVFLGAGSGGAGLGLSFPIQSQPYFKRDLTVLVRDLGTNQVVYETRALHDGVWSDTLAVVPAMLDAALQGFPQPPPGTRRVNIEIPRI